MPTARIAGLTALVETLPTHTQALALAWCDANGVADVAGADLSFLMSEA